MKTYLRFNIGKFNFNLYQCSGTERKFLFFLHQLKPISAKSFPHLKIPHILAGIGRLTLLIEWR